MKFTTLLVLSVSAAMSLAANQPQAGSIDDHIRSSRHFAKNNFIPHSLTAGTYQQAVDHFGHALGQTFSQRYWINSDYAKAGASAPVIYHICGEGDVEQSYFLNDNALAWAQSLGAHIVYLEHRYYGASLPFPDLSTAHLQYLNLENVIEDLAEFQKSISASQGWKGKWVSVGGSYSGTVSAIYRLKHPELVVGALASSAPMQAGLGQAEGSQEDVGSLSSTDPSDDSGERQWAYQACTQLGIWQAEGPEINSLIEYPSPWLCQQVFAGTANFNSKAFDAAYDTPFISAADGAASHVLFTYGSADVWTNLGVSAQKNLNPNINVHVINGAGHHDDLNLADPSDSADVIAARQLFVTLAKQWLGLSKDSSQN